MAKKGAAGKGQPKFSNKSNIIGKMNARKDIKNPEALGAFLGAKKMGKGKFQKAAAKGRAKKG